MKLTCRSVVGKGIEAVSIFVMWLYLLQPETRKNNCDTSSKKIFHIFCSSFVNTKLDSTSFILSQNLTQLVLFLGQNFKITLAQCHMVLPQASGKLG